MAQTSEVGAVDEDDLVVDVETNFFSQTAEADGLDEYPRAARNVNENIKRRTYSAR